jgi:hypothetical protein
VILLETLYDHAGEPLEKIREDILNAEVTFIPADGNKRLASRKWRNLNACRKAVLNHYRGK